VQGYRTYFAVLLAGMFLAISALGCSDDKSRQAGQNIRDEISKAGQLTKRASALMSNPAFQAGNDFSPIDRRLSSADDITAFLPSEAVNPLAWDALREAYDGMKKALADNADASAADQALGLSMLGRVQMVMGDYKKAQSLIALRQAWTALNIARSEARILQNQNNTLKQITLLASASDADLQGIISQADTIIADRSAQQQKIKDAVAANLKKIEELTADSETNVTKATELRVQRDNATREERLSLFDQAAILNKKINDNGLAISVLEQTNADLDAQAQTLAPEIDGAQTRKAAADKLLAAQKTASDYYIKEKGQATTQLSDTKTKIEAAFTQADLAIVQTNQVADEARKNYSDASSSYASAETNSKGGLLGPDALIAQGIAKIRLAQMESQKLVLQNRLALVLAIAETAYKDAEVSAPEVVAKVKAYIVDQAVTMQAAADLYNEAVQAYQRAKRSVPSEQQWALQADIAAASAGRYELAVKPAEKAEALAELKKQLADSLQRKASSPYLQEIVRLQTTLINAGVPLESSGLAPAAPASGPASAPATPGMGVTPAAASAPEATTATPQAPVPSTDSPASPA
jgi:hypothetical protein